MSGLPTEIAASLGEHASGARHERIGAGLDSFLGETHLVAASGVLRVWARGSSFGPLEELADLRSARVEPGGLGAELRLEHAAGESRVRLGHSEQERVAALLESVVAVASPTAGSSHAAVASVAAEALPLAESSVAAEALPAAELDVALAEQRARLLGVLAGAQALAAGRAALLDTLGTRQAERSEVLRARHVRRERERAESASPPAPKAASTAAKRSGSRRAAALPAPELEARVGEAWMPPAAAPAAPKRSALPWVVLVLLLLAGALPALDKLLSSP